MRIERNEEAETLGDRLPWAVSSIEDPSDTHSIAMIALELYPTWPLGRLFGSVPLDLDISELRLPVRPNRCLSAKGYIQFGDFSSLAVADLFDIATMGAKSVVEILQSLVRAALDSSSTAEVLVDDAASRIEISRPSTSAEMMDVPHVRLLARWLMFSGRPASALADVDVHDDLIPSDVRDAAQWFRSLTPLTIGARIERVPALLDSLFVPYDERQLDIIRARFLEPGTATLDELGQRWGVTRERIRQLETKLSSPLQASFLANDRLQMAAAGLRHQLAPMMSLDRLLESNLDLTTGIAAFGLPAWHVLDKLDDQFESDGTWIGRPSLDHLRNEASARIQSRDSGHGAATVHDIIDSFLDWTSMNAAELLAWLRDCGYVVVDDVVYSPTVRSIPDRAAALLSLTAHPMTTEEIHRSAVPDRALTSLTNALAEEHRVCRVGRDRWGLAEWGLPEYTNIRDSMRAVLDEDGQVPLQDLAERLHSDFGVSMASVTMYAAAWPFEKVAGHVRYAECRPASSATLTQARRTYRVGSGVVVRIPVTGEHLRGSGTPAASGMLAALGMNIADKRTFHNPTADVTLSWAPLSPSFSSLRPHVTALDLSIGDELRLRFEGCDVSAYTFDIDEGGTSKEWICRQLEIDHLAVTAVGVRLDLPDASTWAEVLSALRKRGEEDTIEMLVDALTSASS